MARTRPQSPYSTKSDIGHFLSSTYGNRNNVYKSPTNMGLDDLMAAGKSIKTDKMSHSVDSAEKLFGTTNFNNEVKNIQAKIMRELKASEHGLEGERSLEQILSTGRASAMGGYPGISNKAATLSGRYTPGLASTTDDLGGNYGYTDTRLSNILKLGQSTNLRQPSYPFKSYEYESLMPIRNSYYSDQYRLMRPYSSVSFYDEAVRNGRVKPQAGDTLLGNSLVSCF